MHINIVINHEKTKRKFPREKYIICTGKAKLTCKLMSIAYYSYLLIFMKVYNYVYNSVLKGNYKMRHLFVKVVSNL